MTQAEGTAAMEHTAIGYKVMNTAGGLRTFALFPSIDQDDQCADI
jgi:hypothetical protein